MNKWIIKWLNENLIRRVVLSLWKSAYGPSLFDRSRSSYLLISLSLPSHPGEGKLRLMRWKSEADETEKWGGKMCLFAYDSKFKKRNLRGQIYVTKFWAHIIFMVHIPFNVANFFKATSTFIHSSLDQKNWQRKILKNWLVSKTFCPEFLDQKNIHWNKIK